MNSRSALALTLCGLLLGCGGSSRAPFDSFEPERVFYGFRIDSSAPDGVGLFILATGDRSATCELLESGSSAEELHLSLSGHLPGDYEVRPEGLDYHAPKLFDASLAHQLERPEGFVYRLPRGTVSLSSSGSLWPPSPRQPALQVSLDVYAPLDPYRVGECGGGSDGTTSCECSTRDGETATCSAENDEDCCASLPEEYWQLQATLEAEHCPTLCMAASPELFEEHCSPLLD